MLRLPFAVKVILSFFLGVKENSFPVKDIECKLIMRYTSFGCELCESQCKR